MGITTRVAPLRACISAAVRDVWARARGVGVSPSRRSPAVCRCPLAVFRRPDVGGRSGRFLAGEVARGVLSSSLLSLVCPLWPCGGVCGLVSCFFVAVGSLVGTCKNVACRLNFGSVSVRRPCRRVALMLGGVAFPYFCACAWGRIYPNPPALNFPHSVLAVSI